MKITPKLHTPRAQSPENQKKGSSKKSSGSGSQPAAHVSLSTKATFVSSLRDDAEMEPVRSDMVAETRAALSDGTFESTVDMEKAVDSLLTDL
jgi:anti-sigma28 factor (negative regulator of flagellin synthesis)